MTTGTSEAVELEATRPRYVWEQPLLTARSANRGGIDGAVLAALRRGIGREAGTVPQMWPFYRELAEDGRLSDRLHAEHLVMTLFGVHQQSKREPVHKRDIPIGSAMARLRDSGRYSAPAVDRRYAAFATATSLIEAGAHLRGLITQLRSVDDSRLDYTRLFFDLVAWQQPIHRRRIQRQWGSRYFAQPNPSDTQTTTQES